MQPALHPRAAAKPKQPVGSTTILEEARTRPCTRATRNPAFALPRIVRAAAGRSDRPHL
ncbi:hypothetical protein BCEP4_1020018 [Burkholderia cepacia]|nr:hypothetical protein BCEP4_1020018 [Burkholderia cepacia]